MVRVGIFTQKQSGIILFAKKRTESRVKSKRLALIQKTLLELYPDHSTQSSTPGTVIGALKWNDKKRAVWLTRYIYSGVMPTLREMENDVLEISRNGALRWFKRITHTPIRNLNVNYEFTTDAVLVDVFHTSKAKILTGIQRVTGETVHAWSLKHQIMLVAWDDNWQYLRRLKPQEKSIFIRNDDDSSELGTETAIIPLSGRYLMIELVADPPRASRTAAMIDALGISFSAIVYDCVPISSSETSMTGMPFAFANYLDLLSRAETLAPISDAAGLEYEGWKLALTMTGVQGPEILPIELAAEVNPPEARESESFWARNHLDKTLPLITCVGSHEPRKNHLTVLRAAEKLWKSGYEFQLLFIGGNAWKDQLFAIRVKELQQTGFPLQTMSNVSDSEMYAAVSAARFTVFPSLNEGYGLPVAESLLLGTPVITSNFGSTKAIAEGKGGVLVNPMRDSELRQAMALLLEDEEEVRRLREQTRNFESKTWQQYGEETWQVLVQDSKAK